MKYYTVYKITNLVNDKIYIGVHQTFKLDDDYMGSGSEITKAIHKIGKINFKKEILYLLEDENSMFDKEAEIVTNEFIKLDSNYNIVPGGGGWTVETARNGRTKTNKILEEKYGSDWRTVVGKMGAKASNTSEAKAKRKETMLKNLGTIGIKSMLGKNHTDDAKMKIGKANSKYQKGEGNSQFGTVWVSNTIERTTYKIKAEGLENELSKLGVVKGSIRNFEKYFLEIENKEKLLLEKEQQKLEKSQERIKLAESFNKIKENEQLKSLRELHNHLKKENLFSYSEEALRLLLKEL